MSAMLGTMLAAIVYTIIVCTAAYIIGRFVNKIKKERFAYRKPQRRLVTLPKIKPLIRSK